MNSQHIKDFSDSLGLELDEAQEIFQVYVEDMEKAVSKLKQYLECKDWIKLEKVVHNIKGSSGNINVKDVYESAVLFDDRLKSGLFEQADKEVDQIIVLFDEAKQVIKDTFNKNSKNINTL